MHARNPEDLLRDMAWLRRLARQLASSPEAADDLAGDTLATWLTMRAPVRSLRAWLATVLRHHAERHHRREQLRRRGERALAAPDPAPAVDDALATAELHRTIAEAVLELPEPSRSAVVLRFLEDLPLADVARRLQVPVETARTRIKRGIEQLRIRLDARYGQRGAWTALLLPHRFLPATPSIPLLMATKSLLVAGAIVIAAVLSLWMTTEAPPAPRATTLAVAEPSDPLLGNSPAADDAAAVRQIATPATPILTATAVITGRVVDEATLMPLRDVEVRWSAQETTSAESQPGVQTSVDGQFELTLCTTLPEDAGFVVLRHPERAQVRVGLAGASTGLTPPQLFALGDVLMPPGTVVCGTVIDSSGAKAPATNLFVFRSSFWTNEGRLVQLAEAELAGRSNADGSFRLDDRMVPNLPPPLLLAAGELGVGWVDLTDLRRDNSETRVDVQLHSPTNLPVRVVDEVGQPIADALVVVEPRYLPLCLPGTHTIHVENVAELAACFCARTDAHGRATLHPVALRGAEATPYTVRVEATGRARHVERVSIAHADELLVRLPREQLLTVRGVVRDAAGRPIARAQVQAGWQAEVSTESLEDGSYSLLLARGDGPLWVEAKAPNTFAASQQSQPAATEPTLELDFTLQPAIELRGNVVDQDNRPVVGANVWTSGDRITVTDAQGRFVMPVPPASARVLRVQPPEPSSRWLGGIEHLLLPGQSAVTLVLARHAPGRANLEVALLDPQGKPLEPRRVTLARADRDDGVSQPATGTIGHISASGLTPGTWNLRVEPTTGCELSAQLLVVADVDQELRLQQPAAITVRGEIVFEPATAPMPASVELFCAANAQRAHFAPSPTQELLPGGRGLRLQPQHDRTFVVTDVDPTRTLDLVVAAGDSGGDVQVRADAGSEAQVRIVVRTLARVAVRSSIPLLADRLTLQFRRSGGDWGEAMRFEGLAGRTDLFECNLPAGAWRWRLLLPTQGDDNRAGPQRREGQLDAVAGEIAVIRVNG